MPGSRVIVSDIAKIATAFGKRGELNDSISGLIETLLNAFYDRGYKGEVYKDPKNDIQQIAQAFGIDPVRINTDQFEVIEHVFEYHYYTGEEAAWEENNHQGIERQKDIRLD